VTRTLSFPAANPPIDGGIPYLVGLEARSTVVNGSFTLSAATNLGAVAPMGTTAELTGPRFLASGNLVGIGFEQATGQILYERTSDGSYVTRRRISGVNSGTGGQSTPGSTAAFGLTGANADQIIYTLDGATSDLVNVHAFDMGDATDRFLLADVRRVAPLPDGRLVYVFYDNVYVLTVPASLSSGSLSVRPLTTSGGYDGALVFGRHNGTSVEIITIDPSSSPLQAKVMDPANGNVTSTITFDTGVSGLAGGFVLGTAAGLMRGDIVLQRFVASGNHHLVLLDLDASTVRDLTPLNELGGPVLDTVN
jgi:hypothetical protein